LNRVVPAIVAVLLLLIGATVWIGGTDFDAPETDVSAAPPQPGPPRAVRKRVRATADAVAPATPEEEPEAPPPADAASLAVRVVASEGGKPVKAASVTVTDADCVTWTVATDADGAALVLGLPPGATEIRAEAKGLLAATKTIVLAAKVEGRAELTLGRATTLEGVLVDSVTGAPIADAEIEIVAKDEDTGEERPLGDGQTDEKGRYRLDSLPAAGRVTFRVREPGRVRREVALTLGSETGARIEVPRDVSGRLSGTVRNSDGAPLAKASVALRRVGASPRSAPERVADCGKDGSYVLHDVPLGVQLVAVASASGWADSVPTEPMTFGAAAADRHHDFTLRRPATLSVSVPQSREGGPQALLVMVRFDDEDTASALSTGSGTVVRSDLAPGTHRVRVTSNGFLPALRRVELPEGGSAEIEVVLVPGVEIRGRVLHAAGTGAATAAVSAVPADFPRDAGVLRKDVAQRAFTDESGEFAFTGLAAGRYRLVAYFGTGVPSAPQVVDAPASGLLFVLAPGTGLSLRVVLPQGASTSSDVAAIASVEEISPNLESEDSAELRAEPRSWKERSTFEAEVAAGMKWLRLVVPGYAPAVIPVHTDPGKTADLGEVRLEPPAAVKGRVVDSKGGEIAGASVWSTLGSAAAAVRSAADGTFEVGGLAPGAAIVRAQTEGGFGAAAADAGGEPVTIVVRPFGTISGVVVDEDGTVVPHAGVAARAGFSGSPLDRGRAYSASAGEDGSFSVRVPSGRVRVCAGGAWIETTVPPEGETEVKVQRP
jgi:hypothetical protein